jgi:hypothetical protein
LKREHLNMEGGTNSLCAKGLNAFITWKTIKIVDITIKT